MLVQTMLLAAGNPKCIPVRDRGARAMRIPGGMALPKRISSGDESLMLRYSPEPGRSYTKTFHVSPERSDAIAKLTVFSDM